MTRREAEEEEAEGLWWLLVTCRWLDVKLAFIFGFEHGEA